MMHQHVVARRYAKGLLKASSAENLEEVLGALKSLVDMLSASSELSEVFLDPAFLPSDKQAIINRLAQKIAMPPLLHRFLLLLVEKGRMPVLPLIYEALSFLIDEQAGRVQAQVFSATPLDDREIKEIRNLLTTISKKTVNLETLVDESLLGGIKVTLAGTIFDGTVKSKLDAMKQKLIDGEKL